MGNVEHHPAVISRPIGSDCPRTCPTESPIFSNQTSSRPVIGELAGGAVPRLLPHALSVSRPLWRGLPLSAIVLTSFVVVQRLEDPTGSLPKWTTQERFVLPGAGKHTTLSDIVSLWCLLAMHALIPSFVRHNSVSKSQRADNTDFAP